MTVRLACIYEIQEMAAAMISEVPSTKPVASDEVRMRQSNPELLRKMKGKLSKKFSEIGAPKNYGLEKKLCFQKLCEIGIVFLKTDCMLKLL